MTRKLKVGIVGCGKIATEVHLPILTQIPGVELSAAVDVSLGLAKNAAKRYGIKKYLSNYSEILDSDLDVLDICTPPALHAQIAFDAVRSGHHVMVEKPLAFTYADAKKIVDAAEQKKVKLSAIQNYRFLSSAKKLKSLVEEGCMGKLLGSHMTFHMCGVPSSSYLRDPALSGGILFETAVHQIDLFNWFVGGVTDVLAVGSDPFGSYGFLTHVVVLLKTQSKVFGYLDVSYLGGDGENKMRLFGTGSNAEIDLKYDLLTHAHSSKTIVNTQMHSTLQVLKIGLDAVSGVYARRVNGHIDFINQFLASVVANSAPPVLPVESLAVIGILDACQKSLQTESWVSTP